MCHRLETTHWISRAPFSSIPTCRGGWSVEAEEVAPLLFWETKISLWNSDCLTLRVIRHKVQLFNGTKQTKWLIDSLMYSFFQVSPNVDKLGSHMGGSWPWTWKIRHTIYELMGEDLLGAQAYQKVCARNNNRSDNRVLHKDFRLTALITSFVPKEAAGNRYEKFGEHSNHVMSFCW